MVQSSLAASDSRCLLVGCGQYANEGLLDVVSAISSVEALAQALTVNCKVPAENVTTLINPVSPREIGEALSDLAEQASGLLFFYYVGHGVINSRGELYLTDSNTNPNRRSLAYSAIPYEQIRQSFLGGSSRSMIVILDCCFSGRATETLGVGNDDVIDLADIRGAYVISSSAGDQLALAPRDEEFTTFSGELINYLNHGDPEAGPLLTLDDAYRSLTKSLAARGLPTPKRRIIENADKLTLGMNTAATAAASRGQTNQRVSKNTPLVDLADELGLTVSEVVDILVTLREVERTIDGVAVASSTQVARVRKEHFRKLDAVSLRSLTQFLGVGTPEIASIMRDRDLKFIGRTKWVARRTAREIVTAALEVAVEEHRSTPEAASARPSMPEQPARPPRTAGRARSENSSAKKGTPGPRGAVTKAKKYRVSEIARDLGVTSGSVQSRLRDQGVDVWSASSSIELREATAIVREVADIRGRFETHDLELGSARVGELAKELKVSWKEVQRRLMRLEFRVRTQWSIVWGPYVRLLQLQENTSEGSLTRGASLASGVLGTQAQRPASSSASSRKPKHRKAGTSVAGAPKTGGSRTESIGALAKSLGLPRDLTRRRLMDLHCPVGTSDDSVSRRGADDLVLDITRTRQRAGTNDLASGSLRMHELAKKTRLWPSDLRDTLKSHGFVVGPSPYAVIWGPYVKLIEDSQAVLGSP